MERRRVAIRSFDMIKKKKNIAICRLTTASPIYSHRDLNRSPISFPFRPAIRTPILKYPHPKTHPLSHPHRVPRTISFNRPDPLKHSEPTIKGTKRRSNTPQKSLRLVDQSIDRSDAAARRLQPPRQLRSLLRGGR